ncbi:MAG: disulfide isomerase DsbC N-terminal domain-containing protein, partial [Lysobacter sp.]
MRSPFRTLTIALAIASSIACSPTADVETAASAEAVVAAIGDTDAIVRKAVMKAGAPSPATDVQPSPLPGFLEAVVSGRVVYVSADGKYLIQGVLIDVATQDNLTAASEATLHAAALKTVPTERRIIFAAAKPKHTVTIFTDVDCGYCRKLHSEIAQYNDLGITVEYL